MGVRRLPTPQEVIAAAEWFVGCPITRGIHRSARVVRGRRLAWAVMRYRLKMSLPEIGRVEGFDHTTVLHGLRVEEMDPEELQDVWLYAREATRLVRAS
jgi:chromosomal replication initiation ATPase DnaA